MPVPAPARRRTVITSQAAGQAAGENFPVALRLLPARYRRHLAAVYGFARSADDMGDEAPEAERLGLLDELEADLGPALPARARAARGSPLSRRSPRPWPSARSRSSRSST